VSYTTEHIRNLALAGHAGAGKTTLLEALLHAGGALATRGEVERGNTVSDFDPAERARGHSIDTAIASLERDGHRITLIDTPGYAEFRGPALAAMDAVETIAVVVNAAHGIEHGTRWVMERARERGLACILVVNRIDAEHVDLPSLVQSLRNEFGSQCLPVNLPCAKGRTVADCFFQTGGESDFSAPMHAHQQMLDQIMETDEATMEHYLEEGEESLSPRELHDAFERALREGHLVPICFTSARDNVGIEPLLDLIVRLMPSPAERNPPPFLHLGDEPVEAVPDPSRHVIADVFKVVNDPFVGKLGIFRVYQGTIRRDMQLYIDDARKPFRVAHLFRLQGKEHIEVDEALPGDIAAVSRIEEIHFDAVLHDAHEDDHLHLKPAPFPNPMFGLAVVPAHKGQEQKMAQALARLAEEDPCFQVENHNELNETVIRGLSDLHLRLMLERMHSRYGVEVVSHTPRVAYRETINGAADGHHRHKKQTGGAGQFGEVTLHVEPLARGEGFRFEDATKGGVIPGQFIPAIEKGVRQALKHGAIAGYPIQDVRVVVTDGKHHPVDSKEVAFVSAGRKAFLDAVSKAHPQVLEPVVALDVSLPEQNVGDVTGGLASRRAHILGTDTLPRGEMAIHAHVPLAELDDYAVQLKSVTGGQGHYVLEFSHYDVVPPTVQKRLMEAWTPQAEAS